MKGFTFNQASLKFLEEFTFRNFGEGWGTEKRLIIIITQRRSGASQHMTKTSIILICVYIILIACVYIQQFNFVQ